MLDPNNPPLVAGAAVVVAGFAPKLNPPEAGAAVPAFAGAVLADALDVAPPPNEKPPDAPENGLLAGGCEKENDADRPSVDPVDGAAGVDPNIVYVGGF